MNQNEYEAYGKDPRIQKKREEVRKAFKNLENYLNNPHGVPTWSEPLPVGSHGRWGNFTEFDLDFLRRQCAISTR